MEQCPTDSKSLVFVNNSECHLCLSGLYMDVASGANDHSAPVFVGHGDQRDVAHEVDVDRGYPDGRNDL